MIEGYLRELRDLRQTLASRDEDVAEKDAKLSEAREDLERDEAIFAEKMREIKQLRRVVKDAERERADQEERHQREVAALMAAHAAASETLDGSRGSPPAGAAGASRKRRRQRSQPAVGCPIRTRTMAPTFTGPRSRSPRRRVSPNPTSRSCTP